MLITPPIEEFASRYRAGKPQLVSSTLVGDLETPVSAYLKLAGGGANAFLFESVEGGATRGRYSIIGLKPDLLWRVRDGEAEVNRQAETDPDAFFPCQERPLDALRALLAESAIEMSDALPPMAAGVFGYLGYDMVREMEQIGPPNPDVLGVPDAVLMRPTVVVVFDGVKDEITIITPSRFVPGVGPDTAHARAVDRLIAIVDGLDRAVPKEPAADVRPQDAYAMASNTTPDEYKAMVVRAKEYVAAGDIFQVVLSQRFEAPFDLPAFALYRALRRINPAPFLMHLDFGGYQIVGSSPEILVRLRDGKVTIRPIAGTRPRGATPAEDRALAEELLADPKERAEHLMLLDLGRNDVGRVSEIGSVRVTDQFFLEYYSQVMHIVSNVEGRLAAPNDALDALAAGFPAGTVSGAPKVRAMEIIDELEHDKRGVYAGCVGYFGANGEMDNCIVLRTAVVKNGRIFVQAGAGVVAESSPEAEQAECVNKAKALFRAAEEARRFASAGRRGQ